MSEHPSKHPLVKRNERFNRAIEYRRNQTKQRKFESKFLSMDWKNKYGTSFDYSDCCRAIRKLFYRLDAYWIRRQREERFQAAYKALEDYPKLRSTLLTIRRLRVRKKLFGP